MPKLKVTTIDYQCIPPCRPSTKKKKIGKAGDLVVLAAIGTKATLKFADGSPFKSRRKTINIPAGKAVVEEVGATRGRFPYDLGCASCAVPSDPPEMIVG